jgi:hypothetical protein
MKSVALHIKTQHPNQQSADHPVTTIHVPEMQQEVMFKVEIEEVAFDLMDFSKDILF